jgi:hypothetical protein
MNGHRTCTLLVGTSPPQQHHTTVPSVSLQKRPNLSCVFFVPRTTSRCATVQCAECRAAPRVSTSRPSRHAVLEQVTAHVRRGRAHPSAQGQSFILKPPSLLFFYIDPRRRVSAPSTARRAARLCGPAFMPCISFSCRCSCMQLQPGQAHPSAGARAVTCVVSPCTQEACRVEPRAVRLAWVP